MSELTTDKPINLSQLCCDLGGDVPLRMVGPEEDGTSRISSETLSDKELQAAVDAHVADDTFVPPPSPAALARQSKVDALRTKLNLTDDELELLRSL